MLDDKRLGDLSGITRFGDSCGGATHTLQISQHESNHKSDCVAYTLGCTKKSERNQREIREKSERNQREIREKSERNQREIRDKYRDKYRKPRKQRKQRFGEQLCSLHILQELLKVSNATIRLRSHVETTLHKFETIQKIVSPKKLRTSTRALARTQQAFARDRVRAYTREELI